jgi:hypothetical protein
MTTAYSAEELKEIVNGAMLIGMGVAMADMGVVSTAIEASAMSKELMGAAAKYPNNSIIQAAFSVPKFRPNKGQAALTKMAESIAKKGKVMNA